jgi:chromatin remodeling complex protein RSC6
VDNTPDRFRRRWAEGSHTNTEEGGDGMAKKAKVAFGGYAINFKGCSETLEEVMGSKPIGPSEMTKRIWAYVKRKRLAKK